MAGRARDGTVLTTPPEAAPPRRHGHDTLGAHDMSEHKTLLQFLLDLLHDKGALADFREDPQGALHAAGLANCSVDDIKDLLPVVLEKVDPEKCAKYEDDCDKGACHDDAPKHHGDHHHGGHHHWNDPGCDDDHRDPHHHDNEIDKVVTHLNYVTNNYSFDSHDTVFNTTNVTKIWADHGAKVDVTNDTHNANDGGVNVGHDSNAPIATGGHNVVGDGNQVAGDGANAAFGAGSTALSHVGTGDGGAISTGLGSASGNHADTTLTNFGGGTVQNGAANSATDSHDHVSTDNHAITDSQNHTSTDSHAQDNSDHSINTDTSSHYDDSYNQLSHDDNSVDNSIHAHESTVHDPAVVLVP
jgi:hypothetical protein